METTSPIRLGIDFDNTIVCYDELFRRVAIEQKLIPESVPAAKTEIRNHLRMIGREDAWTAMQGVVYGKRMAEAKAFPGVVDFLHACARSGVTPYIISHRTKFPIVGESHDLHAAAQGWLRLNGVLEIAPASHVFFELTREEKIERVRSVGCSHFIDDLPEFLNAPGFPASTLRILFDPANAHERQTEGLLPKASWGEIQRYFGL